MAEPLHIPSDQLERALANAARMGARAALKEIGLHDEAAADDVRELRGLLDAWRDARRTAWQSVVRAVTMALLAALAAGLAVKFTGTPRP
jgi:hypothetical protein